MLPKFSHALAGIVLFGYLLVILGAILPAGCRRQTEPAGRNHPDDVAAGGGQHVAAKQKKSRRNTTWDTEGSQTRRPAGLHSVGGTTFGGVAPGRRRLIHPVAGSGAETAFPVKHGQPCARPIFRTPVSNGRLISPGSDHRLLPPSSRL